jgi:hypothetical protein
MNKKAIGIAVLLLVFFAVGIVFAQSVIPRNPTLRTGTYLTGNTSNAGQWVIGANAGSAGQVVRVLDANGRELGRGSIKFSGRNGTVSMDNGRVITVTWNNETSFSFGDETWRWVRN